VAEDLDLASLDIAVLWNAIESAAQQAGIALYVAHIEAPPRILYVNGRAAEIVGRNRADLIGEPPWSILREEDRAVVRSMIERPAGAPPATMQLMVARPDGRQVPITLATTRMQTQHGLLSIGYFRDLSLEHAALAALRRSEARFRLLVQAAPDGVVILKRGQIVFINPKAARLLGTSVDGAIDKPIGQYLPAEDAALADERIKMMLRDGVELEPNEYRVRADPNRVIEIKSIVCDWDDGPAVLALARDVSERKAIERRLIESDRLAALGTLAAGVAHEINNPLTYAQLSAQLIGRTIESLQLPEAVRDDLRDYLADIDHGIKRVASITQAMRSFVTARDSEAPGAVDLDVVITRALKMVSNDMRHVAELVRDTPPVSPVTGHASKLEQVILNLLINAIKALPTESTQLQQIYVGLSQTGDRVTLTIRDTGVGIPAALVRRIFDPFFTTRDVGHGMGLGLPLSKSIVEQYGGTIDVSSIEGKGTTVRVELRAHEAAAPTDGATERSGRAARRMRVLVVDDESMIRLVLVRVLGPDHDVLSAASGEEALALASTHPFDLILCDVMMPGMGGIEVYRRLASTDADLAGRIVFMSGGTIGLTLAQQLDELGNKRLAKPFTVEHVLELMASIQR
jgi:PAS domain S-box-containing protein